MPIRDGARAPGLLAWMLPALAFLTPALSAAPREQLVLRHVRLELPGAPAALIPADLDGDGRRDLLVVVAYQEIQSIGVDRIEEMVQISTVVPAVFDRREARAYLRAPDGGYAAAGDPLRLDSAVLTAAAGPAAAPVVALTDRGVSALRLERGQLRLEDLVQAVPVLAGADTFFSELEWTADLDGDGEIELLVPTSGGLSIHRVRRTDEPLQVLRLPGFASRAGDDGRIRFPWPLLREIDGDGVPDLVVESRGELHVFPGRGDGTFRPLHAGDGACDDDDSAVRVRDAGGSRVAWPADPAWIGDLDGDGRAELVTWEEIEPEKDGLRAGLKQAKRPQQRLAVHRLSDDFGARATPDLEFTVRGHAEFDTTAGAFRLFRDLDGDRRMELITITLDFSLLQAVRVLATKRMSIGLDFHVWAQDAAGRFHEIPGLDLSEKLKIDLNRLRLGRLAQFAGDFDGDGRIDFVHLGRGRNVTIHRGQPGARYADRPDLMLTLEEEPQDLGLVRIGDLDGDGRADLAVTRVVEVDDGSVATPVVLDLYLSGDGS